MKTKSVNWVDEDDGKEEDEDEAAAHAMTRAVTWEQDEEDEDAEECAAMVHAYKKARAGYHPKTPVVPISGAERF
eukprot:7382647-Prymnesium_polylepis.1